MRKMDVSKITGAVRELCLKANFELRADILKALKRSLRNETDLRAQGILKSIVENAAVARRERIAICQDTGMAVVHVEAGQGVAFTGGDLKDAIHKGVAAAYGQGHLRKSVVDGPFTRKNTKDNTPAVIHIDIVKGDKVKITVCPKGFGSENKSAIKMFRPTDSVEKIKDFVVEVVKNAGPDACPPLVLGIGIGGTFDRAAYLSKKALLEPIGRAGKNRPLKALERDLERRINSLKIGPMGLGGKTTVLGVNILEAETHIAGLPVAVNVSCHATRSAEKIL